MAEKFFKRVISVSDLGPIHKLLGELPQKLRELERPLAAFPEKCGELLLQVNMLQEAVKQVNDSDYEQEQKPVP